MNRRVIFLPLLGLTAVLVVWLLLHRKPDAVPRPVERPTLDSIINVHGSPEQGLKVCGQTFRRVRGAPPYFIGITNTKLVLFAYEPVKGTRMLVVCNTNDCSFREIPLGEAVFGDQIGYWSATKGQMGDVVESVSSNRIALLSKGFRYVERSMLDLNTDTIRVVEVQNERNQITLDLWTNQQPQAPSPK